MNRALIGVIAALAGAVAVACSWLSEFVIANRSDEPITIVYGVRDYVENGDNLHRRCWLQDFSRPATADISSLHWWRSSPRWQELDEEGFHFDPDRCQIKLQLQPGRVAIIYRELNQPDPTPEKCGVCGMHIEIRSAGGTIAYSGIELLKPFEKQGGIWVLSYGS